MTTSKTLTPLHFDAKILEIRGERVMLDADILSSALVAGGSEPYGV
jgi:hypothetical protein